MILKTLVVFVIKLIIYTMFLTGIWILVKPYLKNPVVYMLKDIKHNSKLNLLKSGFLHSYLEQSAVFRHCDLLLKATWKFYGSSTTPNFFVLSCGLFLASSTLYYQLTKSPYVALIACTFTALLPYVILRVLLQFIRTNTSYQLGPAIGTLLAGYRVCNKNIYFAILHTINKLDNSTLKSIFIVLANHIQNHKNRKDIEMAVELFIFKIKTSWAKQLGILLLNALLHGYDIERSLSNIVSDMKEGQKVLEQEQSNSHETILLGYFPLAAFPLTIWFMTSVSGQFNILYYQFQSSLGLNSFILTTILCISSFFLTLFLRKPKNDL